MISVSSSILQHWVIMLLWPLTRVLGVVAIAPILSHSAIPNQIKLGFGLVITLIIIPTLPSIPDFDVFSFQGLLALVQQMIIGLAIGFSMRIVFSAVEIAGQLIGMTMGLGFASFYDPQSQGQSTAISQFLLLVASLVFLSLDGHLLIISAIAESFMTMPIGSQATGVDAMKLVSWGGQIFSSGLLLALPAVAALLITNMALGILTKTAPQLNLFGIGFPVTLTVGILIIVLTLPGMLKPLENMIEQGVRNMNQVMVR